MTSRSEELPGLDWAGFLARWVEDTGGWTALSYELSHRARGVVDLPDDPQTIEKGLRRLGRRGHGDGGQYGRWMLRFFGLPADVSRWLRWMGQYHSRFSDLPVGLRAAQLSIWERAPIDESDRVAWLHLGQASVFMRTRDEPALERRLDLARKSAARAGVAAQLEVGLFLARRRSDARDEVGCAAQLDEVEALLRAGDELDPDDRIIYASRLADQRAYRLLHPVEGARRLEEARRVYEDIDDRGGEVAFAAYQRSLGLAYCAWKMGRVSDARSSCERALDHAGDAGFVRFRVVALNLCSRIVDEPDDGPLRIRARRLARQLEDEELLWRLSK